MSRGIRITAASVAGNTGWRTYFAGADEVAKWPAEGALAVDAAEVLASTRAMTATHAAARHMYCSSAFVDAGPFYEMISAGSNDHTLVAGPVPTWIAAPHITEAQTRRLEPNEKVHAREYGSRFGVEWEAGYFADLITPCVGTHRWLSAQRTTRYTIAIDPAFARDLFASVVVHVETEAGIPIVVVDRVDAMQPRRGEALSPDVCMGRVASMAREYACTRVLSDQHHAETLAELAERKGVTLEPIPWTAGSKSDRFETVRILMRDRRVRLPDDPDLVRELNGIGTRLLPSGVESIQGRRGTTDDRVSALVLAVTHALSDPGPLRVIVPTQHLPGQRVALGDIAMPGGSHFGHGRRGF